jgi:hypothetical protein
MSSVKSYPPLEGTYKPHLAFYDNLRAFFDMRGFRHLIAMNGNECTISWRVHRENTPAKDPMASLKSFYVLKQLVSYGLVISQRELDRSDVTWLKPDADGYYNYSVTVPCFLQCPIPIDHVASHGFHWVMKTDGHGKPAYPYPLRWDPINLTWEETYSFVPLETPGDEYEYIKPMSFPEG